MKKKLYKTRKSKKLNIGQSIFATILLMCILIYGYISQNDISENSVNNQNDIFDLSTIQNI